MNTVFIPPGAGMAGESPRDLMSSASKPISSQLISSHHPVSAANADKLGDAAAAQMKDIESTGGWDAYEVWRRFIKDARARRRHPDSN